MSKRLVVTIVIVLLGGLLLTQLAAAMSSGSYRLGWFTPLNTGGGGAATSTHYAINLTIGQTAYNTASSANYATGLGYWSGVVVSYKLYLPLILK
ncbi:MAG: hypothetical protein U0559_21805 [Anaerolineae bacterium]